MENKKPDDTLETGEAANSYRRVSKTSAETASSISSAAGRLVGDLRPRSILVAGQEAAPWIRAFRAAGIEAWGIGLAGDQLDSLQPELKAYCLDGDLWQPLSRRFDLALCLDVVEHLEPAQAGVSLQNLCNSSEDILFSSDPFDFEDLDHINIQPPEYWAGLFARQGFFRDLDYDASFINSWTVRYRKSREPIERILPVYERRMWRLVQENQARREFSFDQRRELIAQREEMNGMELEIQAKLKRLAEKDQMIQDLRRRVAEKEGVITEIMNSRSWRLMQKVHQIRYVIIPLKSRREQWMYASFRAVRLVRREGFSALVRRVNEKTSRSVQASFLRMRYRRRFSQRDFPVEALQPQSAVKAHQCSVDVIVCVHNALADVQNCLESIVRFTTPPYSIILVDDGSEDPTREYLDQFAGSQGAALVRNDQARGYTRAANQGLRQSSADYAILLNSDTIVTPGWLDRMAACAESGSESRSQIGIVGPISNTASWQSVPDIFEAQGDWADNSLPAGMTVAEMGELAAHYSGHLYPHIPFMNGFCLMLKRDLIQQIGYLDEENFGDGYGEENDYCLRARRAGWDLAVADDTYIYHAQSKSYSHERRKALVERSDKALSAKHGQAPISDGVYKCRYDRVMQGNRARTHVMSLREGTIREGRMNWEGRRVLYVLPITEPGGGGHVILQEAEAMLKMGVDVRILNSIGNRPYFERSFPGSQVPAVYVEKPDQASKLLGPYDAVVGTVFHSLDWMEMPAGDSLPVRGYYIQDFEPYFFPEGSENFRKAKDSYTRFPDLVRLTKTQWNANAVKERIGVDCSIVGPSLDIDLFRPRRRSQPEWPERPLRIAAMIRPSTPRRQPDLTMRVLKDFAIEQGTGVEVVLFGCEPEDPDFHKLTVDFLWRHAGVLTRSQLVTFMNEVDIFADFSSFQAMGLTAMEAMACGVAVIVPEAGGSNSFARHEANSLVIDTSQPEACLWALKCLVQDHELRGRLQQQAIFDICQYPAEIAAANTLASLFGRGS